MKRIFNGFNLIVVLITNLQFSSVCAQNTIQFGGSEIQWEAIPIPLSKIST